jgi:hypothetical protein
MLNQSLAGCGSEQLEAPLQDIHQNAPEIWSRVPTACESVMVPYLMPKEPKIGPLDIKLCQLAAAGA